MTASLLRTSPLGEREAEFAASGMDIREAGFRAMVNVRVDSASAAADAIGIALGVPLPVVPNTVCGGERAAVWLGPDEWLIYGADGDTPRITALATEALGPVSGSVLDLSANRTTIEISGARAREVLAKGCALDLHPRVFGEGHCAQTLIGKTQVLLWQYGNAPDYRILVRASFANYLADWLLDAAASGW
ncbi:sarcosine oxidase subunit gamma [Sciscionella marina]|uniref:sarcosine oxidase subunit gamma n=1 Tax=Sciscionella marina TaxID=508770 RepID=UPI000360511A|nr:sarcosine oxidase subunit gamma family protein [Sciscionella marina]